MSDAETTHASTDETGHDTDDGDAHGSAGTPLGPVDLTTWAYALGGSVLGLLTLLALYVARGA